jgi:NMD protein affecting ribosome stability and mRNA decay
MTRQCPICGKTPTETTPFVEGFCTTCFFHQHPLISLRRPPEAKICSRCQAYYTRGQWIHPANQTKAAYLVDLVCSLLDPLFSPSRPASFEVQLHNVPDGPLDKAKEIQVEVTAHADDYQYTEQKVVTVPVVATLCDHCRQSAGGYFEAVLQIRSSTGKLAPTQLDQIVEFVNTRLQDQNLSPSALKFSETRGGFDIKCISGRRCRILAKELSVQFGLTQKVSSKVVGRTRDGKNLRRDTYSLRFPLYQVGDVLTYKESPFLITGLRGGRYVLLNLESEHRETLSPKELSEIDADFLNDEIQTFQVISVEGDIIQLMSQADYTMYDFPRPDRKLPIGTIISAIEWNHRLVLLPQDDELANGNNNN